MTTFIAIAQVLAGLAPSLMSIFMPTAKETTIVNALVPTIFKTIGAAETIFGPGTGPVKLQAATDALQLFVSSGLLKGHTAEEFTLAMPLIQTSISNIVDVINQQTRQIQMTSQPFDIVGKYLAPREA